jgi:hypothetical protein
MRVTFDELATVQKSGLHILVNDRALGGDAETAGASALKAANVPARTRSCKPRDREATWPSLLGADAPDW